MLHVVVKNVKFKRPSFYLKIPINLQGRVASAFNPTTQEAKAKGLEA
jgi:hypothetical protein